MSEAKHGTYGGYTGGCRCEGCRAANTEYQRRARQLRLERGIPAEKHGKDATYANWACRCLPCTEAHRSRVAADRSRARSAAMEAS
jgi:hypothetical protein